MIPAAKINVAWVTSGFYFDENDMQGAPAIFDLANEISKDPEIELTVFALYYPKLKKEYNLKNIKVYTFFDSHNAKLSSFKKLKIWRLFRRKFTEIHNINKFDLIHSFWAGEPGYNAAIMSKKLNIPLIANICGGELAAIPQINYGSQLRATQKYFINRTFEQAEKIVCGSDFILKIAADIYSVKILDKFVKIPFGIKTEKFSPQKKSNIINNEPVLINIAHIIPVKAHNDLLEATLRVKKIYPKVKLKIYGSDNNNFADKLSRIPDLNENVEIYGFTEHDKLPDILKNGDIFVLSSLYESQNVAILEAAFSALPVVSTDVGIAREITPYISAPGDINALTENILKAIKEYKTEYKDLTQKFSLQSTTGKYKVSYQNIKR